MSVMEYPPDVSYINTSKIEKIKVSIPPTAIAIIPNTNNAVFANLFTNNLGLQ